MEIEIYTIPDCVWCTKTERLLKMANLSYDKHIVGENISLHEVQKKFPMHSGYPIILLDKKNVYGLIELAKLLVQKGLVSSKYPKKNESGFTDK